MPALCVFKCTRQSLLSSLQEARIFFLICVRIDRYLRLPARYWRLTVRLRRAADGHYYIKGPIFGGGPIATFQISPLGLDVLKRCDLAEGHQIPHDLFARLHKEKLIRTGGGGVGDPTQGVPLEEFDNLIADLKAWGVIGNPEELRAMLREHYSGIPIALFFPETFCRWTLRHETAISPDSLADLSFSDIYEHFLSPTSFDSSYLHHYLLQEVGGCRVLYHLMKWVAEVYRVKNQQSLCPEVWAGTIHETIFNLLSFHLDEMPQSISFWKRSNPIVRWRVFEGTVELMFPEQLSPSDAHISFIVDNQLVHLQKKNLDERTLWFEATFPISSPENPLKWQCNYTRQERSYGHSSAIFPNHEILLWEIEGSYIDPTEIVPPGVKNSRLFLLARNARIDEIRSCKISIDTTNQIMEPEGWKDWSAYRIEVPPTLERLGPYRFLKSSPSVHISIPDMPSGPVQFAHATPVFLGKWPLIHVHSSEDTIRVSLSTQDEHFETSITEFSPSKLLDLNSHPGAAQLFGPIRIKVSGNSSSGFDACTREIVRLPEWHLSYIASPDSAPAKAVSITTMENGTIILGLENCEVTKENLSTVAVSAANPIQCPIVFLGWERPGKKLVRFNIRVPIKRGANIAPGKGLPKWLGLPLRIDVAQFNNMTGEVRIEFDEEVRIYEPDTCHIKGSLGPPHKAGHMIGQLVSIPVHRLRDFFHSAPEAFFIRTKTRWECFLEIEAPPGPPAVDAGQPELLDLLWNARETELKELWQHCIRTFSVDRADKRDWFNLFLGPHLGDWKRTGDLLRKLDIPESTYLRLRCTLRCHFWDLESEELRKEIKNLPLSSYKTFTDGEYWYRLARSRSMEAPGALDAAYERLFALSPPDPATALETYCLASFVAILRNRALPSSLLDQSPMSQFMGAIHRYCSRSTTRDFPESVPPMPKCLSFLLVPEDVSFLLACRAQIERDLEDSRQYLESLSDRKKMYPVLYDLLWARQYRREGQIERSRVLYRRIVNKRDFILDEMYS